ncbi:MAG: hypothetical protein ACRDJH_06825 [Thermomicrobiales bacterium]
MEATRVSARWGGADRDILTILVDPWPRDYGADPDDEDDRVVYYRLLDDRDEATGEIVGIEIDDFVGTEAKDYLGVTDLVGFDAWDALPVLPQRWQLRDWEPLSLVDLLKRLQASLGARVETPVRA